MKNLMICLLAAILVSACGGRKLSIHDRCEKAEDGRWICED